MVKFIIMGKGYIYLLLTIDVDGSLICKIGVTKRLVDLRISEHQTGNPNKITVHSSYKSVNYFKVEKWMLRKYKFQSTEVNNEWRKLTDEQVFSFIDDCKDADDTIKFLLENNELYK